MTTFLSYVFDKTFSELYLYVYLAVCYLLFHKNHSEIECVPPEIDRYHAFHKGTTRPTGCCKNLQSGGSRVLPSLAALAWDQIAARSAFFEDETKCIGINMGQAEDEKSQAKDEKSQVTAGTS